MEIWEQLRLVLAYSTDDYMKFDGSTFGNVGRVVRLAQLNQQQIEQLIKQYELPRLGNAEVISLMSMVGGHPYLIQQALYYLKNQEQSLADLLRLAPTLQGIYKSHLEELSNKLNTQPILYAAFKQILHVENKAKLSQEQTFKLEGMGLVQLQGNQVHLSCELYDRFFRAWF